MADDIDFDDFFDAPANSGENIPAFHHRNGPLVGSNDDGDGGDLINNNSSNKKMKGDDENNVTHNRQFRHKKSSRSQPQYGNKEGESTTDSDEDISDKYSRSTNNKKHTTKRSSNKNKNSSRSSSTTSSSTRSTGSQISDHTATDGESDSANIVVEVHEQTKEHATASTKSRRYISKNNHKKPPLPSSGDHSAGKKNQTHSDTGNKSSIDEESVSLLAPGSTFYTSDGRKMRKGRCRYSDKEVSDSASSGEDELHFKPRSKRDPIPKLGLGDLVSPRSDRSNSRSRGNSSEWSTGSDKSGSDVESHRPRARLSRRHSSSSESGSHRSRSSSLHSDRSGRRRHRSRSSDSSITVSSLSDTDVPDKASQDISSPAQGRHGQDSDRLSLEILLSALLDADKDKSAASSNSKSVRINVPSQHQHRSSRLKANYTFSNDRSKTIDMENQRLLNNILAQRQSRAPPGAAPAAPGTQQGTKPKSRRHRVSPPRRVTNSTVNRIREQQRIERENLALLRRLNQIKPSAEISRNKCLVDYNKQIAYHCPDMRATEHDLSLRSKSSLETTATTTGSKKQRPASANYTRSSSSYSSTSKYTRPASATNRPASATNRPTSATNRPTSSSTRPTSATYKRPGSASSLRKRPEWQSGW